MGGISCRRHAFVLLGGVKGRVSVSLSEEEVRMDGFRVSFQTEVFFKTKRRGYRQDGILP